MPFFPISHMSVYSLVCFLFSACSILEPVSFDLSLKSLTDNDNLIQSLGQEAICRSETNWDLGLGEFYLDSYGSPLYLFPPHLLIFSKITDS